MTNPTAQPADSPDNKNDATPWALLAAADQEPVTTRKRRIVEKLPDWEPLPPGEILVRRRQQD